MLLDSCSRVQQGGLPPSGLSTFCDCVRVFVDAFVVWVQKKGSQQRVNEETLCLCWGSPIHLCQLVCVGVRALRHTSSKILPQAEREKHDLACLIPQLSSHWPLTRLMPAAMLFKNDAFPPHHPPSKCMKEKALAKALNKIGFFHSGFAVWRGGYQTRLALPRW